EPAGVPQHRREFSSAYVGRHRVYLVCGPVGIGRDLATDIVLLAVLCRISKRAREAVEAVGGLILLAGRHPVDLPSGLVSQLGWLSNGLSGQACGLVSGGQVVAHSRVDCRVVLMLWSRLVLMSWYWLVLMRVCW